MAVSTEILSTYRDPRGAVRRLIAAGRREDRALAILMGAALMVFVAQWPMVRRQAFFAPDLPFEGLLAGRLMAILFVMPLAAYVLAALSHLLSRAIGGHGSAFGARIALFWALLAVSPLMLVHGLIGGYLGPGPGYAAAGALVFATFLWVWLSGLREAEFGGRS